MMVISFFIFQNKISYKCFNEKKMCRYCSFLLFDENFDFLTKISIFTSISKLAANFAANIFLQNRSRNLDFL